MGVRAIKLASLRRAPGHTEEEPVLLERLDRHLQSLDRKPDEAHFRVDENNFHCIARNYFPSTEIERAIDVF